MKISRITLLSAALTFGWPAARAMAADVWGASWSFGPTTSRIIHARTTMVPGRLPPITATTGPLFLWPGLSNPTSDLIQTTMDAWPDNKGYCGAATGQWCVEASVFGSFGQRNGPTVAIDPDDHVTIEYTLGADGNTWTQVVTSQKLAKMVSTLQSTSGPMPKGGFGFATEADADSFTIDTQYYLCTELDLAAADPHFGATGVGGIGAQHGATGTGSGIGTAKNLRTSDGGLTWLVDLITLPAMQPQGAQAAAPAIDCTRAAVDAGADSGPVGSDGGGSVSRDSGAGGTGGGGTADASGSGGTSDGSDEASSGGGTGTAADASSGSGGTGGTGGKSGAPEGGSADASSRGDGSTGGSASSSGDASASAAASDSDSSGCSCALVGARPETGAGLSALVLGLAATFVRRRRTRTG